MSVSLPQVLFHWVCQERCPFQLSGEWNVPCQLSTLQLLLWYLIASHTFPLRSKKPYAFVPLVWLTPSSPGKWMAFSEFLIFIFQKNAWNKTKKLNHWDEGITLSDEKIVVTLRIVTKALAAPKVGASLVWTTGPGMCGVFKISYKSEELACLWLQRPPPSIHGTLTWECSFEGHS